MDRRAFIGGLIAMPAIIKVAGVMRIKPFAKRFSFSDIECFVFDNSLGKGAISLDPISTVQLLCSRDPYIAGMLWNDNGTIRISEG